MAYTAIDNPELYMQTVLWTGNDSTSNAITLSGDENMQPDLIWQKQRNKVDNHQIFDSVRGITKRIKSNSTEAETTVDFISSIDSDGFTIGSTDNSINDSSYNYVAWCWKESATAGFDIVSWSGTGSAKTEAHSLSAVPHFMFSKNRADATNWAVYHHKNTAAPETEIMYLNLNSATADDNAFWNDTAPTSSVFSVGTDNGANGSSDAMITYLFSEKQGYSKFGSYTGNNNADGTFVYTGFKPAFVMNKVTNTTDGWMMHDNKRNTYNPLGSHVTADGTGGETDRVSVDFLSNGFKWRVANTDTNNGSYIYMAFAEAPFVNSNGVPCNAR